MPRIEVLDYRSFLRRHSANGSLFNWDSFHLNLLSLRIFCFVFFFVFRNSECADNISTPPATQTWLLNSNCTKINETTAMWWSYMLRSEVPHATNGASNITYQKPHLNETNSYLIRSRSFLLCFVFYLLNTVSMTSFSPSSFSHWNANGKKPVCP